MEPTLTHPVVRTLTYTVTEEESGHKIEYVLRNHRFSSQSMKELKKEFGLILLNNAPVFITAKVSCGDSVCVRIVEAESSENIIPVHFDNIPNMILYEDEDILVINKPAGMPIHPSLHNETNSLASGLADYYAQKGRPFVFRCITRLDKDTSGVCIIAKHYLSSGILGSMVKIGHEGCEKHFFADANHSPDSLPTEVSPAEGLTRRYLALCKGEVTPLQGTVHAPIGRKDGSVVERCVDYVSGENATTHYHVIAYRPDADVSLVYLQLETGRTHQIRIHMMHLGFPIIGDYLYHPDFSQIGRQALHSYQLSFTHPITGTYMTFTAPLPEDMNM